MFVPVIDNSATNTLPIFDEEMPKRVTQSGDHMIVHTFDENGVETKLAGRMAQLYRFELFRGETEIVLHQVHPVVFETFLMFLYDTEHPEELEIFNYPELAWLIPQLAAFLITKLKPTEFATDSILSLFELALWSGSAAELPTAPHEDLIVFKNESIFYEEALKEVEVC